MLASRLIGFPVLLALAASCAPYSPSTSVTPERGPVARIHATYSGGLTQRTLRADFTVNRPAYVMVGHLGGDGMIEILYPANANRTELVGAGQSYAVSGVPANYDGVPQLFSYATRAYRSTGARTDSYDGRGNGFVFIIASSYPLFIDDLQEGGEWTNNYEVENYSWISDPRLGIKAFADHVAGGPNYTLRYANSFSTNALVSYASRQWDCSLLSSMYGYGSMFFEPGFGNWGSSFSSFSWYYHRPASYYTLTSANWYGLLGAFDPGCGDGLYSRRYTLAGYFNRPTWESYPTRFTFTPSTPPAPAPTTPQTGSPLDVPRRAFGPRPGTEAGSALALTRNRLGRNASEQGASSSALSRSRIDRNSDDATSRWASGRPMHGPRTIQPSERAFDPPRQTSSRNDSPRYDSPRHESPRYESPRAPVHEAPRISNPAPERAAPAASAPSSPPPKIEAASGRPGRP